MVRIADAGLQGRSAIVTGSTSGIGLGIARALAEAGANVTLNGFGDPREIERIRADLAERTGVTIRYSSADMSKGEEVVAMVREAEAAHGVVGLTKVVALETAAANITCNAICPGFVHTPLVEGQFDEQAKAHGLPRERVIKEVILASQPNQRFVEVEEFGALAVFLCSDAGRSITGAALPVDGGWTAR